MILSVFWGILLIILLNTPATEFNDKTIVIVIVASMASLQISHNFTYLKHRKFLRDITGK